METQGIKEFMLVGRVLGRSGDSIEIEVAPGLIAVLDVKTAIKIEEYTDPETGIGAANIFYKAGEDISAALKPNLDGLVALEERMPFVFGQALLARGPSTGPGTAGLALRKTASCYKTNETTSDCGPDDSSPNFSAGF